jgi:DNA (cytosine-5)-methyltransferase 1
MLNTLQNTGRGWWNQSDIAECIRTPCGGDSTKANLASDGYAVRRLTPLECERLQGYPDGWTDIGEWTDSKGKVHKPSDSARYKALGNSIALPQWRYVLGNIAERLPHGAELGSLFDGIGGFPLVWSEINGEEACLWASEIEEFPIAVTKRWFPEGGENDKIDRNA